jgi:hypothetical protein
VGRAAGAAAMNWTTEKPTVPGWYWYRGECDGHTEKVLHYIDDDGDGPYIREERTSHVRIFTNLLHAVEVSA